MINKYTLDKFIYESLISNFKCKSIFLMSHLYHLLSYIPLNFLYIISSLISKFLPHVYRRNVVKKNLINSFPKISKFELDKLISNFYTHFCDVFFETIKSYSISTKELKKRVVFSNFDELNHKLEKKEKYWS